MAIHHVWLQSLLYLLYRPMYADERSPRTARYCTELAHWLQTDIKDIALLRVKCTISLWQRLGGAH